MLKFSWTHQIAGTTKRKSAKPTIKQSRDYCLAFWPPVLLDVCTKKLFGASIRIHHAIRTNSWGQPKVNEDGPTFRSFQQTIPRGVPLPTEHSKNYDSAWDWL